MYGPPGFRFVRKCVLAQKKIKTDLHINMNIFLISLEHILFFDEQLKAERVESVRGTGTQTPRVPYAKFGGGLVHLLLWMEDESGYHINICRSEDITYYC